MPKEITYTAASILGQHLGADRCAYATVDHDQNSFVVTGNYATACTASSGVIGSASSAKSVCA